MLKFVAGKVQGFYATNTVDAATLVNVELSKGMTPEQVLSALKEDIAVEMVQGALVNGNSYAIQTNYNNVKNVLASELQSRFMARINGILNAIKEVDSLDLLIGLQDEGKISKQVADYISDKYDADIETARQQEIQNAREIPAVEFEMKSALTTENILAAMATQGLTIGGSVKTPAGEGTVAGFKVTAGGTMAWVRVNGNALQYTVEGLAKANGFTVVQNTNNQTKGDVVTMNKQNQSVVVPSTPAVEASKDIVKEAMEGNVEMFQLTPEQAQAVRDAKQDKELAERAVADAEKAAKGAALASSGAAQMLLGLSGNKGATPAAQTPKAPVDAKAPVLPAKAPVNNAQPAQSVAPAANAAVNNNTTQNNGGNVQMTNTQQSAQQLQAAGASLLGNNNRGAAPAGAPSLMLATGDYQSALSQAKSALNNRIEEFAEKRTERTNNDGEFVWYLNAAEQMGELVKDLASMVATIEKDGQPVQILRNTDLGIAAFKLYTPAQWAAIRGWKQTFESDVAYVQVFLGTEKFFSATFTFRMSVGLNKEGKLYLRSENVMAVKNDNGWNHYYVTNRKQDTMQVVVHEDKSVRAAELQRNGEVVEADKPFAQEVKPSKNGYVAQQSYDSRVAREIIVQVFVLVDELIGLKGQRDAGQAVQQ